jgi:hypothetical protein
VFCVPLQHTPTSLSTFLSHVVLVVVAGDVVVLALQAAGVLMNLTQGACVVSHWRQAR